MKTAALEFKMKRIDAAMEKHGVDILVASLPQNICYLTDYMSMIHDRLGDVHNFLVYNPKTGDKIVIVSAFETPSMLELADVTEVLPCGPFIFMIPKPEGLGKQIHDALETRYACAGDALVTALKKAGATVNTRIGLDESVISPVEWNQVVTAFPGSSIAPAAHVFNEARAIKHPDEVKCLKRAATIVEQAIRATFERVRAGLSEKDLYRMMTEELAKRDGEMFFAAITVGHRTPLSDTSPTDYNRVQDGSVIRFDLGCKYDRMYVSDIARTAVYGTPPAEVVETYESVKRGQVAAAAALMPGRSGEEVYRIGMDDIHTTLPRFERQSIGHGIGLTVHETFDLCEGVKDKLEEGMVYCVETPHYEVGWYGLHIEDMYYIGKSGAERLTEGSNELFRIERKE